MNRTRLRPAAATALLVLAVSIDVGGASVTGRAVAATPTCHGRPATIVGRPGQPGVEGTKGDDVIVSNGADAVDAGPGDDLVCVTGSVTDPESYQAQIDGGDGDDVIDGSASRTGIAVDPGAGDDTVIGSDHADFIDVEGQGVDTVRAGAGDDDVRADAPAGSRSRDDVVDLGTGDDDAYVSVAGGARIDGGGGADTLVLTGPHVTGRPSYAVDATRQRLTRNGRQVLAWTQISDYDLFDFNARDLGFTSGAGDTTVTINGVDVTGHLTVATGAGDDDVQLVPARPPGDPVVRIDGGPGRDRFETENGRDFEGSVGRIDLAHGTFASGRSGGPMRGGTLVGIEDAHATLFSTVTMIGTAAANRLKADFTCAPHLTGGAGPDQLTGASIPGAGCPHPGGLLRGGPGDDRLLGGKGDDRLIGGSGHDRADGRAGTDTCVAEVRVSCEKR